MINEDSLSVFTYHYLYNGGGVGIADFNDDGFKDIFLGGNMVSSKLLLGNADMDFKVATQTSGLTTNSWINGVSVIDLNNDGRKDIYLSVGGPDCAQDKCRNLLFLNETEGGQIKFVESSSTVGLDVSGYSQQGLFFDADLDGDLDMYQVQNYVDPKSKNYPQPKRYFSKNSYDKFFLNQEVETGELKFIDASAEWNVQLPGFGLGIAMTDFNSDGYPDLYIANDFITDDILYLNKGGKGFSDCSAKLLKHSSYNSMGIDVADVNEDALEDILVVDMLPYDNQRQKTMLGAMNYDKFLLSRSEKYNAQYIRNTLQLNNGLLKDSLVAFSELAAFYDLHQTDWSWSPLIADFDNDMDADIFISNGYGKNITDLDFVNYNATQVSFGGKAEAMSQMRKDIAALPPVNLPNQYFEKGNEGSYTHYESFTPGITNGVAYSDLDNDGDLDLILNNLNEESSILVNQSQNNYIKIQLKGDRYNLDAIGAEVRVTTNSGRHLKKTLSPVRSYLSSMDSDLVFGLNEDSLLSVEVKWPDNSISMVDNITANQSIVLDFQESEFLTNNRATSEQLVEQEKILALEAHPIEQAHDFSLQSLLPKSCRRQDHLMALSKKSNQILLANHKGGLSQVDVKYTGEAKAIDALRDYVISDLKIIDQANEELLFVSAYDAKNETSFLIVLEMKEEKWAVLAKQELPLGSYKLAILDDLDDALDVALAQYPHPNQYPVPNGDALSAYHWNDGTLSKKEIKHTLELTCLTDISYVDLNGEGNKSLLICGEWMAPLIGSIENETLSFCEIPGAGELKGFWQDLQTADLDNDGDLDIVLGNIGQNTRHKFSYAHPLHVVADDLDGNGSIDPILSYYNNHNEQTVTYHSRDDIARQLPKLKLTYPDYKSFSRANFSEILNSFKPDVQTYTVTSNISLILENRGACNFVLRKMPNEAQYSIINKTASIDLNNDGLLDLIALSNCLEVESHNGNIDGLNGLVMINKGDFIFEALNPSSSGLNILGAGQDIIQFEDHCLLSSDAAIYSVKPSKHE